MNRATWGGVVTMVVGLALAAGCSKNEAASTACSSMKDSDSCSACCTKNGASGYKFATGSSCDCIGGSSAGKTPEPSGPSGSSATVSFAGTYKSTWGPTVFSQDGNRVTAKYPNGNMTCTATGNTLDCNWVEGSTFGKAKLVKEASGSIKGTWGNGGSATNGGPWIFNP